MKKIRILSGIVAVLAVAGGAVFIATFDAGFCKSLVEKKLQEEIGKPVSLGRVALGFSGGISLEVKDIAIFGERGRDGAPAIKLEEASLMIRFMPLLRKSFEVGAVKLVKPRFNVVRGTDEIVGIEGLAWAPPPKREVSPQAGLWAFSFFIDEVDVEGGEILFKDKANGASLELPVRNLDMELDDISPGRPVKFHVRAAVFGRAQNLDMSGRFRFPGAGRAFLVEDAGLRIELDKSGAEELFRVVPGLNGLGLNEGPAGKLEIQSENLEFGEKFLERLNGRVRLTNGRVFFTKLRTPFENISLDARLFRNTLQVNDFSAILAEGKVRLSGTVQHLTDFPSMDLTVLAEALRLDSFYSPSEPDETIFQSHLTAEFRGTARGLTWPAISRTLSGDGRISFPDAAILNFNLLREAMRKLVLLPGLVEKLLKRLSVADQMKLKARDTVFHPVDFPVTLKEGVISSERVRFATDTLEVTGPARLSLADKMLSCQGMLRIYPAFGNVLTRSVNKLQDLKFADGWIGFPVKIQGKISHPALVPDVHYLNLRLAVDQTGKLFEGLLEKTFDKKDPISPQSSSSEQVSTPSARKE